MEQHVTDGVISKVEEIFLVLIFTKGNVHTYLVMKIRYLKNRRIAINMKEYIIEAVQDFGGYVLQVVNPPSSRWLFTVGKVRELQGKRLDTFHSVVMKILWILQIG